MQSYPPFDRFSWPILRAAASSRPRALFAVDAEPPRVPELSPYRLWLWHRCSMVPVESICTYDPAAE